MTTSQPTIQARTAAPDETYPRWVRWVTHAAVLPPLPSGIWRIAMAAGVPVGFSDAQLQRGHIPGWGSLYLVGLSAVAEACALLTLGFIRPWGVVFPHWLPGLGGRRVPPAVAIIPASLAAFFLTFVSVQLCLATDTGFQADPEPGFPTGAAAAVMLACYLPLLAWGPLLAAATVGYCLRLRRMRHPPAAHRRTSRTDTATTP
jgi:hypothetical protein